MVVITTRNADGSFKETAEQVMSVNGALEMVPSAFLGLISNLDLWNKSTRASYKYCT